LRKDGLTRHYRLLTADDRFRLVLEAKARQDEAEVDRLKRSCPTKTYRMSDGACADRFEAGELIAPAVSLDLTLYLAKMKVAGAYASVAPDLRF
jgi:hypothetical protein